MSAPAAPAVAWRDPKRYEWPLALSVPLLPFIAYALVQWTGAGVFWWTGPFFMYVVTPLIDALRGEDAASPPEAALAALEADRYYRWLVFLYVPLQYAALVAACAWWAGGALSWMESLGLALTIGGVGGIAINTAHELGHKRGRAERWLSKVALAQTFYGHFYVEHNRGHHVQVATPEDPSSARLGESFWAFLPRTVCGGLASAWSLEAKRLRRLGRGTWSVHNDVLNAWAMSVALFAVLVGAFGAAVVPWLAFQALFGLSLLEVVNYIEHYGLLRQKTPGGRYERCRPEHSWNSNHIASNVLLYHLQRHSDHHAWPTRRYQALRHHDAAPQLPAGYPGMILLAYVPPLWRRVMDPKVLAHYGGDASLANRSR
jgi:alkane 1-monooxygenase